MENNVNKRNACQRGIKTPKQNRVSHRLTKSVQCGTLTWNSGQDMFAHEIKKNIKDKNIKYCKHETVFSVT